MMGDPTYIQADIESSPVWYMAWLISEHFNNNAPIGWSRYIPLAAMIQAHFSKSEPQPDLSEMMEMVAERQISFHFQKNTEGTLHYTTEGKPYYSDDSYWSCNLVNGYNGDEYNGEGPTPVVALAAAMEEMK